MYSALKTIHVTTAALTFVSFALRGIWMLIGSPWLERRAVRIAPHVIDAVLLISAIGLMLQLHQYPGTHGWLTAKLLAIVSYIMLGSIALRRGRTRTVRTVAWVVALGVFAYIVAVALTRNALPFLSG
jgi:uncharacterized membrane protein SirB2